MLSIDQKLAITEVWSALRPEKTSERDYPLLVEMIAAQVELALTAGQDEEREELTSLRERLEKLETNRKEGRAPTAVEALAGAGNG